MTGDSRAGAPQDGVRCMLMRGGTSKGLYFLASDLPADPGERDALLPVSYTHLTLPTTPYV